MEIREYRNGKFQVWNGSLVLRPSELVWEASYQCEHDFMYYNSLDEAKTAIRKLNEKQKGRELVRVHPVQEDTECD